MAVGQEPAGDLRHLADWAPPARVPAGPPAATRVTAAEPLGDGEVGGHQDRARAEVGDVDPDAAGYHSLTLVIQRDLSGVDQARL